MISMPQQVPQMVSSSPLSPFFAFFNFFLMFLFRFFMFYFMFKCESPPNSVAYDWWRRQSYATLLDWTMGSGGLFCCVPLLALVCLGSGGWPMFRCVPLLASGTQPIVCRYWHRVVWDLGAVPLCAAIGIWNSTHCVPLLASGCLGSGGWPMFRCVLLLASEVEILGSGGSFSTLCRYWHCHVPLLALQNHGKSCIQLELMIDMVNNLTFSLKSAFCYTRGRP